MKNTELEKRLYEINHKLDVLTEQMIQYERRQREWQELKDDLSRIGAELRLDFNFCAIFPIPSWRTMARRINAFSANAVAQTSSLQTAIDCYE